MPLLIQLCAILYAFISAPLLYAAKARMQIVDVSNSVMQDAITLHHNWLPESDSHNGQSSVRKQ